jgi:hypothetical protein
MTQTAINDRINEIANLDKEACILIICNPTAPDFEQDHAYDRLNALKVRFAEIDVAVKKENEAFFEHFIQTFKMLTGFKKSIQVGEGIYGDFTLNIVEGHRHAGPSHVFWIDDDEHSLSVFIGCGVIEVDSDSDNHLKFESIKYWDYTGNRDKDANKALQALLKI